MSPGATEIASAQNPMYHLAPTALTLADREHGVLNLPPPPPPGTSVSPEQLSDCA